MAGPRSLLHKLFSREKTNLFDDTAAIKLPPIHFEEAKRRMQDAEVRKQTERSGKSVICVDVDGVIHSYTSGWQGATVLADPPVPGAIEALHLYLDHFEVAIYSARSCQMGGIKAIREYIDFHDTEYQKSTFSVFSADKRLVDRLLFPASKPAASLYIDDRGFRFEGVFPDIETIIAATVPWYKK